MASVRDLWLTSFPDNEIPAFPCPLCDRGNLLYIKKSLQLKESDAASAAVGSGDITPFEVTSLFAMFLKCSVGKCGCVVSVHGEADLHERYGVEDYEDRFFYALSPHGMFPAPPLATIPPQTPGAIANELKIAFQLFWIDLGSCANRLRISVEKILDELGAPKGKLFDRIDTFKKSDPDHADTFDALRHVGNVGSHEGVVERDAVLDAFEVYQDALAELFGKRSAKIAAMKQTLIQSKGKY